MKKKCSCKLRANGGCEGSTKRSALQDALLNSPDYYPLIIQRDTQVYAAVNRKVVKLLADPRIDRMRMAKLSQLVSVQTSNANTPLLPNARKLHQLQVNDHEA